MPDIVPPVTAQAATHPKPGNTSDQIEKRPANTHLINCAPCQLHALAIFGMQSDGAGVPQNDFSILYQAMVLGTLALPVLFVNRVVAPRRNRAIAAADEAGRHSSGICAQPTP